MKERETYPGKTYAVTSANGCTIYRADGVTTLKVATAGQDYFVAAERKVYCSDDAALVTECFNSAPTSASGGGVSITVDQTYDATSANAQSGVAVSQVIANCFTNNGSTATLKNYASLSDWHYCRNVIGYNAKEKGNYCSVYGAYAEGGTNCSSFGYKAIATAAASMALGSLVKAQDVGVTVIGANSDGSNSENYLQTLFYIVGAGSPLAVTYEDGEACLGYVVKDKNGNISACGTRKLSELLTNNTAFAPAMLDLDSPAPTPFLPTGIMEPLVDPEDSIIS
jgi:hypothetical protein